MSGAVSNVSLKLKDVLSCVPEYEHVVIEDEDSNVLSEYDGNNSISKALMNLSVFKISSGERGCYHCLIIEVYDPLTE